MLGSYIRLSRLHSPTGALLLLWPCLWSIVLAMDDFPDLVWMIVFFVGAFVMRSAGCVINDLADIDIDKQVLRTRSRPLASGEISLKRAFCFLGLLLLCGLAMLLSMHVYNIVLGFFFMVVVIIYPFTKRFFLYPQVVLGVAFSAGALMGWIAVKGSVALIPILLYIGTILWVIFYDTIYAHQDKEKDKELGLYSTTLTAIGSKVWLFKLCKGFMLCWLIVSALSGLNFICHGLIVCYYAIMHFYLKQLDLDNPNDCMKAFKLNSWLGLFVLIAFFVGKIKIDI